MIFLRFHKFTFLSNSNNLGFKIAKYLISFSISTFVIILSSTLNFIKTFSLDNDDVDNKKKIKLYKILI